MGLWLKQAYLGANVLPSAPTSCQQLELGQSNPFSRTETHSYWLTTPYAPTSRHSYAIGSLFP
jgi:hypothetical protein